MEEFNNVIQPLGYFFFFFPQTNKGKKALRIYVRAHAYYGINHINKMLKRIQWHSNYEYEKNV